MNKAEKTVDASQLRLSDYILHALELAIEQEDVDLSEMLVNAIELSMTRNAGGSRFVERRDYPQEIETALEKFHVLKHKK